MALHGYYFVTQWKVSGTVSQVYAILNDVSGYPRWWPSLAACFECLAEGNADGVGAKGNITTKGFLPYIIRWTYEVVHATPPHEFSIRASGDLTGEGHWTLKQENLMVKITYEWNVQGDKALLRYLSPILRPLFTWNHNWVMARGKEGLVRELQRTIVS